MFKKLSLLITFSVFTSIFNQTTVSAAEGKVNTGETQQTMEGFGASIAYYENFLVDHPYKDEIYDYIFFELGLDILRLPNRYRNGTISSADRFAEIVQAMYDRSEGIPKIQMSSWSPPANLKNTNNVNNGGTLRRENGEYVYGLFAQYWLDALAAYAEIGIIPDWISLQNEPSYTATWESCIFSQTETTTNAGYNRALDTLYSALQELDSPPKLISPEVLGIGYSLFQNYARNFNHDFLDGYAFHLYHGESNNINDNSNPDLFIPNLRSIATTYPGKPIFQTEYDRGDWFNTVWLMHNCLVEGDLSAYLYWGLVWDGGVALLRMESPYGQAGWTTPHGYVVPKVYWAFRQYSKYISSGWKRVDTDFDSDNLRLSAFASPDGKQLTLVVLNVGAQDEEASFDIEGFNITSGKITRTSETEDGDEISGNYDGTSAINIPARSIMTLAFSGQLVSAVTAAAAQPTGFSLYQNYPNPFNPATTIEYTIPSESFVQLKIYDVLGREIRTLVNEKMPPGKHKAHFNATDAKSGIYFYKIKAGDFRQTVKMLFIR